VYEGLSLNSELCNLNAASREIMSDYDLYLTWNVVGLDSARTPIFNLVRFSTLSDFQPCPIFNLVRFSALSDFQPCPIFNLVRFSTLSDFQPCPIFNLVRFSTLSDFQPFATYPNTVGQDELSDYNLTNGNGGFYTGSPWHGPVPSEALPLQSTVAHIFNDGTTMPNYVAWPGLLTFLKDYRVYELESASLNNVERIGLTLKFRTTQDVSEGQELCYRYGQLYWLQKYLGVAGKPYTNLMNGILHSLAQSRQHMNYILDIACPLPHARIAVLDALTGLSKHPRLSTELGKHLRMQGLRLVEFLDQEGTSVPVATLLQIQREYEDVVRAADAFLAE
jgi:hypothetical protein